MTPLTIDSLFVAAPPSAAPAYRRLGLPAGDGPALGRGLTAVTLTVGRPAPTAVHLVTPVGDVPASPLGARARRVFVAGPGLFAVGVRVNDVPAARERLASLGAESADAVYTTASGERIAAAWLPVRDRAGADLVLVPADAPAVAAADHAFPLKRLDHLAAVAHDLEAATRFWADVLGVPASGDVTTPAMVIRKIRIGGAVFELLGPSGPDSPVHKRTPGLVSMASWEVADLDAAVAAARAAGFEPSEPAKGMLPGTRISTIPGDGLAGVNMQLLQYV
jgi:catechol 2,3-dioxygenase-like lactoylglutathione lyase family enzyme